MPSAPSVGPTPEDPEAAAILGNDDPRVILERVTIHPGDAPKQSYKDREEFLKQWRG